MANDMANSIRRNKVAQIAWKEKKTIIGRVTQRSLECNLRLIYRSNTGHKS